MYVHIKHISLVYTHDSMRVSTYIRTCILVGSYAHMHVLRCACTQVCTYTHEHTCVIARMYERKGARALVWTAARIPACTYAHLHGWESENMSVRSYARLHVRTHALTLLLSNARTHACTYTRMHGTIPRMYARTIVRMYAWRHGCMYARMHLSLYSRTHGCI